MEDSKEKLICHVKFLKLCLMFKYVSNSSNNKSLHIYAVFFKAFLNPLFHL